MHAKSSYPFLCAATVLFVMASPAGAQEPARRAAPKLREVLREKQLEPSGPIVPFLDKSLASHELHETPAEVCLAFFERTADDRAGNDLNLACYERRSRRWRRGAAQAADATGLGNSIVRMDRSAQYLIVDTHLNPSAGRLVVFDADTLQVRQILDGWTLSVLPNEFLVVHQNQVHFAPTHVLEVALYDPLTKQQRAIYPPKAVSKVRQEFVARVAQLYRKIGEEWFAKNNHHMDASRFDSSLMGDIKVTGSGRRIEFRVRFGKQQAGVDPIDFFVDVRVSCDNVDRLDRAACTEDR